MRIFFKIIKRLFHRKKQQIIPRSHFSQISYAQCGEDIIMKYICNSINLSQPTYMDIGAHHPYHLSNTAYFYEQGSRGINIEASPISFQNIITHRPEDINLNIGMGGESGELDFFLMEATTLNTFSAEEAEKYQLEHNIALKEILPIKILTFEEVIRIYNNNVCPDILSIDVEGKDWEILNSIDFDLYQPKIICVETLSYSTNGRGEKRIDIIHFLESKDYLFYADTYINSIFVLKSLWVR